MVPMVSAAWNRSGIMGGSCSASTVASAGAFKGKLRVKWLWLIVCPSFVCGFLDCFCSGLLLRRRHLRRAACDDQQSLAPRAGESRRRGAPDLVAHQVREGLTLRPLGGVRRSSDVVADDGGVARPARAPAASPWCPR